MASQVPRSMRAVALAKYCKPSEYDVASVPTPQISQPDQLLVKVHAASINPIDVKLASGMAKMLMTAEFPYLIGYDLAGTVVEVGASVTKFQPGDEVFARSPLSGTVAQYALTTEAATARKPSSLSFVDAASIPLAALTALQCLQRADQRLGGLQGKTVLVPGGLSATGLFAVQLAKNVYGADKVITTLSTGKMAPARDLLGADTFVPVDYTKQDVPRAIGPGVVDYLFDTMDVSRAYLSTMKKGGAIVSIAGLPSGDAMAENVPGMPLLLRYILNWLNWGMTWWIGLAGVRFESMFMHPDGKDLDDLMRWMKEGKLRTVVGRTAKLSDVEGVRSGCQQVYDAKGGVGKFVIEMD